MTTTCIDAPKQSIEEDQFSLAPFVEVLSECLLKRSSNNGYVLGLEGQWGSGKSTIMNFVANYVRDKDRYNCVIRFNPWLYNERRTILKDFFSEFASGVEQFNALPSASLEKWNIRKNLTKLASFLRKYGAKVDSTSTSLGTVSLVDPSFMTLISFLIAKCIGFGSKLLPDATEKTLQEMKAEIEDLLVTIRDKSGTGCNFTIIVDDIDRLEPDEMVEMLRLFKAVGDFPLTTYVVCFDEQILCQSVGRLLGYDKVTSLLYINKIFQGILTVPQFEAFALRKYLRHLLEADFPADHAFSDIAQGNSDRKNIILDQWAGDLLHTPRDVMRLVEAVHVGWPSLRGKADFLDYVWLQMVRLKKPDLYIWVKRFVSSLGAYRESGRIESDARQDMLKELAVLLDIKPATSGSIRLGLSDLLPCLNCMMGAPPYNIHFDAREIFKFEDQKRLGSPSHWRLYFAYGLPTYSLTDDELNRFCETVSMEDYVLSGSLLLQLCKRSIRQPGT